MRSNFTVLVAMFEGELSNRKIIDVQFLNDKDKTIQSLVNKSGRENYETAMMYYKAFATALSRHNSASLSYIPVRSGMEQLPIGDYSDEFVETKNAKR